MACYTEVVQIGVSSTPVIAERVSPALGRISEAFKG